MHKAYYYGVHTDTAVIYTEKRREGEKKNKINELVAKHKLRNHIILGKANNNIPLSN